MAGKRRQSVPNYISVKVCDELYKLMAREAEKSGRGLIDVAVEAIADQFKRPDLGFVPRKQQGRKPYKELAGAK